MWSYFASLWRPESFTQPNNPFVNSSRASLCVSCGVKTGQILFVDYDFSSTHNSSWRITSLLPYIGTQRKALKALIEVRPNGLCVSSTQNYQKIQTVVMCLDELISSTVWFSLFFSPLFFTRIDLFLRHVRNFHRLYSFIFKNKYTFQKCSMPSRDNHRWHFKVCKT